MKTILPVLTTLFMLMLISVLKLEGQRVERKVDKTFDANTYTNLEVDSKFGNVSFISEDSDLIRIEAVLWVEGNPELLDKLDIELTAQGDRILINSVIPDKMPSNEKVKFSVDINIHAPSDIDLTLNSKYGSAYIEELSGNAIINIAYGNIKIMELNRGNQKPLNQLNMSYSTGTIEEAGWLVADLSYSKLSVEESSAIVVLSKYSGLTLDECSSLVSESKYDTYRIGELNNYVGEVKYGNLSIDELTTKFDVNSSYSSIKIGEVDQGFESIRIENSRGSAKLSIDGGSSFKFYGEAKRGDISITGIDNINKRVENADKYFEGQHGDTQKSNVEIYSTEGSVKISVE